jgi:hypothetical protein
MNATLTTFYLIQKIKQDFFLDYIPYKENKCWKSFKIMRKSLFKYFLYSHPEIRNFRVWQASSSTTKKERKKYTSCAPAHSLGARQYLRCHWKCMNTHLILVNIPWTVVEGVVDITPCLYLSSLHLVSSWRLRCQRIQFSIENQSRS